jgi:hypothetical protein
MLNLLYPLVGVYLVVKATKWALGRKWFEESAGMTVDELAQLILVKKRLAANGDLKSQRDLDNMRVSLRRLERLSLQGDIKAQKIMSELKSKSAISPDDFQTAEG